MRISGANRWMVAAGFVVPIVLATPVLLKLHGQIGSLRAAHADLVVRTGQLRTGVDLIADLESLRTKILDRGSVLEVLQAEGTRAIGFLNALGTLPEDWRIESASLSGDAVEILAHVGETESLARAAAALRQHGLQTVHIENASRPDNAGRPARLHLRAVLPAATAVARTGQ